MLVEIGSLPIKVDDNGDYINAEPDILNISLDQIESTDNGKYYFVDISKLGKIHLSDDNRGYIINEETLNVYVTTPIIYKGVSYYTLTPDILGKNKYIDIGQTFEIAVAGNPVTWATKAELLVSITDEKINENILGGEEGWTFKWLKGTHSIEDFRQASFFNYFIYGETIKVNENGIYTVFIESPEGVAITRKIVVTKIDNIPPTITLASGDLIIDDAETGVRSIRCKIKETNNFAITNEAKNKNSYYYTMGTENISDTAEDRLSKYLWEGENIKGETINDYVFDYSKYSRQLTRLNEIIDDEESTDVQIQDAVNEIRDLNERYPQFAYNNTTFPDTENNIVVYVEDMCGNGTVYSAINRSQLMSLQYVSSN